MVRISPQTHITRTCGSTSKRYLMLGDFDDFKFGNGVFLVVFQKKQSVISRRKQRLPYHEVSEFDRGRIVARIVQRLFVNHQIELFPWPVRSPVLSAIENMWSMVARRLTHIALPADTSDQL
ncbi:uncharacterized protein TNCV_3265981 [Trichonephila clavipes]|nr:uncharacterized protein TNCV_3265981 [Trichonephila clavipes]